MIPFRIPPRWYGIGAAVLIVSLTLAGIRLSAPRPQTHPRPPIPAPLPQTKKPLLSQKEQIWQALFLHIMEGSDASLEPYSDRPPLVEKGAVPDDRVVPAEARKRIEVVFLSIADADPPKGFLSRLGYTAFPVKPASRMKIDQHRLNWSSYWFVDKGDGRLGICIGLSKIEVIGQGVVRLRGDYGLGGRNGYGGLYTLRRIAGTWKVIKVEEQIMA